MYIITLVSQHTRYYKNVCLAVFQQEYLSVNANCNSEVVLAISIACFKLWPDEPDGYGEEAVATLTKHYGPMLCTAGVDTDSMETVGTAQQCALRAVPSCACLELGGRQRSTQGAIW